MKSTKLIILFSVLVAVSMTLAACSNDKKTSELKKYVTELKSTKADKNITATEYPTPQSRRYQASQLASPFLSNNSTNGKNLTPLQRYPVAELRLVGSLEINGQLWAAIVTPDGRIYRATVGSNIGQNNGRIVKVTKTNVEISNNFSNNKAKRSAQQIVYLRLKARQ